MHLRNPFIVILILENAMANLRNLRRIVRMDLRNDVLYKCDENNTLIGAIACLEYCEREIRLCAY